MKFENQIRGARNRAAGEYFENYVDAACEEYSFRGIAQIEKTPEPMKIIKKYKEGMFIAVFKKKAQPDYKGTIKGRQTVIFDAKHTDTDRITKKALSDEQEEKLIKHQKMGAIAFVLVSIRFERVFRVPIDVWVNMKDIFGHQYMTAEEMRGYEIKFSPLGALEFLEGLC